MAKLYLKFKESLISEICLQDGVTTIGRAETNSIRIDNLAMSGSHARIVGEDGVFTIEDLNSTNGTYVDDRRISRHRLAHNAVITVGKHTLVFLDPKADQMAACDQTIMMRKPENFDATMVIAAPVRFQDMDQTIVKGSLLPGKSHPQKPSLASAASQRVGELKVLDGSTDRPEYLLEKKLVTIGKASTAEIRLKGFFVPKVAAAINKSNNEYYITPASDKKVLVNGNPISDAHPLKQFDIIEVASLRLQFSYRDA